ncbi:hypothetical protein ONZ45_g8183 [Pleurotus djamor]|nr:hypothetical protein ONZ45_g8183 [Pleurotus djamor]
MSTATDEIDQKQTMIEQTRDKYPELHYRAMAIRDMLKRSWVNWKKCPMSLRDSCFDKYGDLDLMGRMWALEEAGLSLLAKKFQREESQPDDASDDEGGKDLSTADDDSDVEEIFDPRVHHQGRATLNMKPPRTWTDDEIIADRINVVVKFLASDAEAGIYATSFDDPVFTAFGPLDKSQKIKAVEQTMVRHLLENFELVEKRENGEDNKENVDEEQEKQAKKPARGRGRPRKEAVKSTEEEAKVPIHQSIRRPIVGKRSQAAKPKAKPRTKKAEAAKVETEGSTSTANKEDEDGRPKKRARRTVSKVD